MDVALAVRSRRIAISCNPGIMIYLFRLRIPWTSTFRHVVAGDHLRDLPFNHIPYYYTVVSHTNSVKYCK